MSSNGAKIYLAAPLFAPIERDRNRQLRDAIARIANVFLPQEDGELIFDLIRTGVPIEEAKARIFASDIKAINECDILIIVLDGRSVDEGASFELGYAFCLGKTCIGLKTDSRTLLSFGDNPMIEGALSRVFNDDGAMIEWLESWVHTKWAGRA